jgi:hypothetical protein
MGKRLATTIAGGAWTQVTVDGAPIALAQGASYSDDFNVQPLEVLNHLGPISYESFGYTCEITIRLLVAKNKADFDSIAPLREDVQKAGFLEDHVVSFVNTATATVHNAFSGVVVGRVGENIEANQFVAGDITMYAVERLK